MIKTMTSLNHKQKTLGIGFTRGLAFVAVWAPFAETVDLYNESRHVKLKLQHSQNGYWQAVTEKIKPGDLYFFILNGKKRPDPASLSQPMGIEGPSRAIDLHDYSWRDKEWKNPPIGDYIIYELHTGTFSPTGDFAGIISHLDALRDLGITAIEFMPVAQFPGERNWGYDGVFPFAVQNSYGGATAFRHLTDTCHQKGIAVILDVVYNHIGPEGNCLEHYGPYFTDKYKTPWGKAINFDDAYCDPVRQYYLENALMWFRDFHVDALRLDAIHAIKDFSPVHILKELADEVAAFNKGKPTPKYLMAESDLNNSIIVRGKEDGGLGLDAQWCDDFHHALAVATDQDKCGRYTDFSGIRDLARSYKNAYVFTGQYSHRRQRRFGTSTTGLSYDHFIVFSQNHDQVGNKAKGERFVPEISFDTQKLVAAAVITSPFIPLLFMGEEWGTESPFPYFADFADADLRNRVIQGRREEFAHFASEGQPLDPHEEETFLSARLQWKERREGQTGVLLSFYKFLIALRKSELPLRNYDRRSVNVSYKTGTGILVVDRIFKEQHILCMFNYSKGSRTISLKQENGRWRSLLSSSDTRWLGKKNFPAQDNNGQINIEPESVILLANYHVPS
ncbi:MAG TPA: malto-oligosyltrehalose trehalohydrolase [Edaphocola sp.]|nr:malto-oligosyltrehalose trehalohydrolase [Edaphocola sp.]